MQIQLDSVGLMELLQINAGFDQQVRVANEFCVKLDRLLANPLSQQAGKWLVISKTRREKNCDAAYAVMIRCGGAVGSGMTAGAISRKRLLSQ